MHIYAHNPHKTTNPRENPIFLNFFLVKLIAPKKQN